MSICCNHLYLEHCKFPSKYKIRFIPHLKAVLEGEFQLHNLLWVHSTSQIPYWMVCAFEQFQVVSHGRSVCNQSWWWCCFAITLARLLSWQWLNCTLLLKLSKGFKQKQRKIYPVEVWVGCPIWKVVQKLAERGWNRLIPGGWRYRDTIIIVCPDVESGHISKAKFLLK